MDGDKSGMGVDMCLEVYVLIRFDRAMLQAFRNAMVKEKSVIQNYGGRWLTIARQVHTLDQANSGDWPSRKTLAVLAFPSREKARLWFQSDPIIRQQDWIGGVDVIIVPLQYSAPRDRSAFVLIDATVIDEQRFINDYVNSQIAPLRQNGAACYVVASKVHENLRGGWVPRFVIMHQFYDGCDATAYYSSNEYENFRSARHASARANVVLFQHEHCDVCQR